MSQEDYIGPAYQAHTGDGQLVVSVERERCEQVSLDGRRCWRTVHVDWCCGFDGPPVVEDWRGADYPDDEAMAAIAAACTCPGCMTGGRCVEDPPEDYYRCCALDDGHDGCCAWVCNECNGTAACWVCDGTGDDGSGLDDTCTECCGGRCQYCYEGMEVQE